MRLFWMEQLQFARPHTSHTTTSLHLKSRRCDHPTTRKISKNKPILFDIHQTLNAIDTVTDSLLHLPLQFRKASGFRPPLATLLFYLSLKVLVSPALCQIDCGLSSLLMLQCEENTPSPGSLAASPRLWLAVIKSQWHHPFSSLSSTPPFPSFSDHSFIVFILISTLHSPGARWNVSIISSVIGRIFQSRWRDSVRQRSDDMVNAESCSTAPLKGYYWWFGGCE